MRFFSFPLCTFPITGGGCCASKPPRSWARESVSALIAFATLLSLSMASFQAYGQAPGTPPPAGVFNGGVSSEDETGDEEPLPIQAFVFLSESESPVMMPGLSWEEFERLLNLDTGVDNLRQTFSYQAVEVEGTVEGQRAELTIQVQLSVEPTGERWLSIPLRMRNFHRLAPPDVTGVDEYAMALSPEDDQGYLLFVRAQETTDVTVRMSASARVDQVSSARTLAFELPDVPTRVELQTDANGATGEVVGRGDETIQHEAATSGQTRLIVESGGGDFAVRWGKRSQVSDAEPLLEVESQVDIRWDSPQDQPIASVRMTIKNIRGSIRSFPLRLPPGAVILDAPRLGSSGQTLELGEARSEGRDRTVVIPEEERQQRIDLNFELQLANDNATASSPFLLQIPQIVEALRHRGEIKIQTGGDYRLRWRSKPWVRGTLVQSREETTAGRFYSFRFDRDSFELPLWLGEKERQLRLISQSQITIRDAMATLEMTIQVSGQAADGRLQFDDAGWRIQSIESTASGSELESFQADPYRVIEFDTEANDESAPIRIRAERTIEKEQGEVRFGIPRVVEIADTVVVQSATASIVNSGRTMLVVDLDASDGLTRVVPSTSEINLDSPVTRLRLLTQEAPPVVVGKLIDQLPRITLASETKIQLDGKQLRTNIEWIVSSGLDLEGILPVHIPAVQVPKRTNPAEQQADDRTPADDVIATIFGANRPLLEAWVVTVDGVRGELRPDGDDRYTIVSPNLQSGSMTIRWYKSRTLSGSLGDGSIEAVALPRPDFPDVTVRGTQQITLQGNQRFELTTAETPSVTTLAPESLPRDPIRLRLQSRLVSREELSIRQMILRTAVGRSTRFEQVLAEVQGGDQFRVDLPEQAGEISVEARIDDTLRKVRREGNTLSVALPGDQATHIVDLRVWIGVETPSSLASVQPVLKLPVHVGRIYWQIIAPLDGHVIWAAPTLGRSKYRDPTRSDSELNSLLSAPTDGLQQTSSLIPPGNQYLYVGSDIRSFEVLVVSRVVLWVVIGSLVLLTTIALTTLPQLRHPVTAVAAAVLLAGLLAIAPDAAVLAGQFAIVALVLVIVMITIRALISPSRNRRVFSNRTAIDSAPSTQTQAKSDSKAQSNASTTQTLPPPTPTEAST